ncbi:MAG: translation initiation factor IF-2 [Bacteroidetes bacterium GWD2_45_23]|nr:MAG: translation initiation factor IF-2 [Bacteroidetes bacterium GWC2_46_850]OFX87228.1 MAG: translation initiation factor IF-2 [Bacteroidetes bacterium GWD2_45_23]HBB01755.1 translation initiation factor IF-2 [Porphyromonadaceae bacterium]HCC17075.1 translation initiation factor IF-2 [Porphyromonadaceae bacterium]
MPIRLIKVSKNLNVGINSLVEFLHKKGIEIEANPNAKIEDEQYNILIAEFGKDKNIRREATETREKMHRRDEKRETVAIEGYELPEELAPKKKVEKEIIETEIPKELKPHFNVVGSIDLDNLHKKRTEPKQEEEIVEIQPEVEIIPEPVITPEPEETIPAPQLPEEREIVPEPAVEEPQEPQEPQVPVEKVEEENAAVIAATEEVVSHETEVKEEITSVEPHAVEAAPEEAAEAGEAPQSEKAEAGEATEESVSQPEQSRSDKVFRLHKNKLESNIVVKGSIDLDAINDRTRPPRKSRAQRKKERLEREQKALDGKKLKDEKVKLLKKEAIDEKKKPITSDTDDDNKKKKRTRIRTAKVNIDKPGTLNQSSRGDRKPSLRKPLKAEVSEEDVQKQIKETLARLTEKRGKKGGAKYRREKREASAHRHQEELKQQERESRVLQLTEFVTANDLANMMNVPVTNVISTCMSLGVMVAINQRLDAETINIVAEEYGFKTQFVSADVIEAIAEEVDDPEDLISRPPIVTVMGHVDHGKTSLLDSIRSTNVIAGEAGGITQHIGAYNVQLSDGRKITFLDTPGHEAFTAMRARGAKVTDVAIIIVAADDNVMPQTVEAINHAGAAGVPIVFAINKIDKPGANPEKIKERLAEMNYLVEDWGGKYQSQDISAKKGVGIQELLEKVLLEADLLELKANPDRRAAGSIIESELDKGRGYVSTVLVENGTLHQGDIVIAGAYFGRVKAMFNERNQRIEEAGPAEPALILGLNGAPQAGDTFNVMETEQEARSIANRREQLQREQSLRTQKMLTLDDIGRRIAIGNFQQLNIIVKGDVDGSVEALSDSLIRLSTEEIQVNVIHKAVGQISESDVTLAAASDAIIIGFQVRPSLGARKEAEKEGVDIRLYSIIYDAIEEVKAAMEGMLSPEIKEDITGNVEVLDVFKITKVGTVAGSMVRDGKIKRSSRIRLVRDGIVIFTGELDSLKRFKEDVKEVTSGYECGITIRNFNDIKVGDVIEAYEETEIKKTL